MAASHLSRVVRGTCRGAGYEHQYDGGYEQTHPGKTLVGRAVTAMYMPRRPAMREVMEAKGEAAGQVGDQISWPIDALVKGDCYVADCFGKIAVPLPPTPPAPHPAPLRRRLFHPAAALSNLRVFCGCRPVVDGADHRRQPGRGDLRQQRQRYSLLPLPLASPFAADLISLLRCQYSPPRPRSRSLLPSLLT